MKPYGLILAGGGAKGAYQIGAWKAMRELNIEFEAIAGASVGAINGAMIAQGDFDDAYELWSNVEVSSGVNIQGELKDPKNLFSFSNFPKIAHEIIRNGGVDVTPAKELISAHIDEKKVRASNIPLAIETVDLDSLKPVEMFVDEMPEGELIDYLMASARVPGLNRQGPKDGKFLDGGVYDNTPIGILRKRGINRLIVVDISGIKGIGHKEALSCADIVYIVRLTQRSSASRLSLIKKRRSVESKWAILIPKRRSAGFSVSSIISLKRNIRQCRSITATKR